MLLLCQSETACSLPCAPGEAWEYHVFGQVDHATFLSVLIVYTLTEQRRLTLELRIARHPVEMNIAIVQRWLQNVVLMVLLLLIVGLMVSAAYKLVAK